MGGSDLLIAFMLGHGRLPVREITCSWPGKPKFDWRALWTGRTENGLNRFKTRVRPGLAPTYEDLTPPSLGCLPLLRSHHRHEHSSNAAIRLCVDVLPVRDYPILEKQAQIYRHGSGQRTSLEASPFVLLTVSEAQPFRTS